MFLVSLSINRNFYCQEHDFFDTTFLWSCKKQKQPPRCVLQDRYWWRSSFFSKAAGFSLTTLLKLSFLKSIFSNIWLVIKWERKAILKNTYFCVTCSIGCFRYCVINILPSGLLNKTNFIFYWFLDFFLVLQIR